MRQLTQPPLAVETTTPASEYETRPDLSAQQLEALKLKAKGYTDIQIGNSMPSAQGLSNKESHARKLLTGAYQELGTKSSIIAIIKAMDLGYITSDDVLSDDEKAELHSRYVQLKPTHTALLDILTTDDETKKTYKYLVGRDPRFTSVAIIRRIASSAQTTLHTNDIYHTAVVYAIAKKIYGNVPEQEAQPSSPLDSITPRQKQIINLMLQGYNEEQIAGRLVLSDGDTERQFSKRTISEENAKIRKALGIRGGSGDNLALHTILTLIDLDTQGTVIDPTLVIQNMDLANLQKLSQEQLPQDVQRVLSELIRDNGAESTNEKIRDRTGIAPGTIKNYFYRLPFATKLQAAVYWKMKDDPRLLEAINDRLHPELSDHNE